ncbi:MAG: hypothetical protein QGF94_03255 [Candidatus Thalassarchaeaceae archaeon]|jgi:hypothetical protein|nr:hypothetical protein [Candidatus Thalassarchaeaceae archaeon]
MAKKDTYLALLRRGVDETTAMTLADSGLKIGEIKKLEEDQLVQNYGLKPEIARSVLEVIHSGTTKSGKERFLSGVLSGSAKKEPMDKIEEQRFKREQKDIMLELQEQRERLKMAKVEQFRSQKVVMNRLGKTIELIVKLENNFDDESKEEQRSKIRDQLETRGLEAARDHELLELEGTPQDIVDFRRKIVPKLCFHSCPGCGEEMDPRSSVNMDLTDDFGFICWDCGQEFSSAMADVVGTRMGVKKKWIAIDPSRKPREKVFRPPKAIKDTNIQDMIAADLAATGATADTIAAAVEESNLTSGLMSINEWIDQTLAVKGYIQAQEDREDFIIATGAGATKFNKWMKKAGLAFNKQTGQWTRWSDR